MRSLRIAGLSALAVLIGAAAHADLRKTTIATGFTQPLLYRQDPTNPNAAFVVQQNGLIRVLVNGMLQTTPFLNVSTLISTGGERGLLGLAFPPDYAKTRLFYINYTNTSGSTVIAQYRRSADDPLIAEPTAVQPVITIGQPFNNHNGGHLEFGPDGMLYTGMGDGGSGNDPGRRAQNPNVLLGKMLRIDPSRDDFPTDNSRNYGIPSDNPFLDGDPIVAMGEIWAFGLRNPWRWTFDDPELLGTGALVIADVGEEAWEEVNYEPAGAGGRNYGWRVYEGNAQRQNVSELAYTPVTFPIAAYNRTWARSITGGFVYRGTRLGHRFFGRYVVGDFVVGRLWSHGLTLDENGEATVADTIDHTPEIGSPGNISSFGVDSEGEIYVVSYGGTIYRLDPNGLVWITGLRAVDGGASGGIRHLYANDDRPVTVLLPTVSSATAVRSGGLEVDLQTDLMTQPNIDVDIRARFDAPATGFLRVQFYDWGAAGYSEVALMPISDSYATLNLTGQPASRFRSGSGAIRMRFLPTRNPSDGRTANLQVDSVRMNLR